MRGNRGSVLAWTVVALSEFLHSFGLQWGRPEDLFNLSTLFASADVALLFPAAFLLATAHRRYVRVAGFILAAVLACLTLLWFQTPLNLL